MNWEFRLRPRRDGASASYTLGNCQEVRDKIDRCIGEVAWVVEPSMLEMMDKTPESLRTEGWSEELIDKSRYENCYGYLEQPGLQFHFADLDRDPLPQLHIEVEGEGDPIPTLQALCRDGDWEAAQLDAEMRWQPVHLEKVVVQQANDSNHPPEPQSSGELDALEQVLSARIPTELLDSWEEYSCVPKARLLRLLETRPLIGPVAVENALRICQQLLGPAGSEFVMNLALGDNFPQLCYPALFQSLSVCCGVDGFAVGAAILEQVAPDDLPTIARNLLYFEQNELFLNWVEFYFQERHQNVSSEWGNLLRECDIGPQRLRQWLQAGTALATIALDAIIAGREDSGGTPGWQVAPDELRETLEALARWDDSPMLLGRIQRLQDLLDE